MRIGICDDEKIYVDNLTKYYRNCVSYVEKNFGLIDIDTFASGEELLEVYRENRQYDILFLDIKMKIMNGFETAKQIRTFDNKVIIIFITSLAQYVFKSFEFKPFWYLIKPVSEENFRDVLYKALTDLTTTIYHEYAFKTREGGIEKVNINSIIYFESISRQVRLHTLEEDFSFYASISNEEEKLANTNFIRVHKSYLVNMQYIKRINQAHLTLKTGETVPISERRYKAVYDFFTNYLARSSL